MTDQTPGTDVVTSPTPRQAIAVHNVQPMFDTARFEHFQRAARALMHSSIMNPSIRGNSPEQAFSNLMLLADQSDRWKLPLIAIVQETSIVHDKLVFSGKLIAAALSASLGIRLHYHYVGERGTPAYRIFVSDQPWEDLDDAALEALRPGVQIRGRRIIDGSVAEWRTFKKDGTTPNPAWTGAATQNQLAYRGAREWARRFEPAHMLGVYGEDEIDDINLRMDRARDITPAQPVAGLSGGFTRPAPDLRTAADIADADFEETTAADTAQETQEGGQERQDAPAATDDAAQEPAQAQAKPAAPKKAAAKKGTAKPLEAIEISAHQAFEEGLTGGKIEDLVDPTMRQGEAAAIEKAWRRGRDELDALLEQARAAGQSGVEIGLTNPKPEETALVRQLELVRAAYAEGQAQREEDAALDAAGGPDAVDDDIDDVDGSDAGMHDTEIADDDDAIDAIRDAEPDAVDQAQADAEAAADDAAFETPDAIDDWVGKLPGLMDWKSIKSSLGLLVKTEDWKAAGPARQKATRAAAWRREAELIEGGHDRLDFINDLTAWRCWIETTDDVDAINGNWMTIVRMPLYQGIEAGQKAALEQATLERVEEIQAARG